MLYAYIHVMSTGCVVAVSCYRVTAEADVSSALVHLYGSSPNSETTCFKDLPTPLFVLTKHNYSTSSTVL